MTSIRITSKRQATLPKALCDEMRVEPGDRLLVERRRIDDRDAWVLIPEPLQEPPGWIGSLRKYAVGLSHDMDSVRRSIKEARARDKE